MQFIKITQRERGRERERERESDWPGMPREWSDASGIKGSGESTFIQSQHRFLPENHIEFWAIFHWHFHKRNTHTHTEIEIDREREKFIRIIVSEPSGKLNSRMGQMSEKEKKRERKRERIPKIHHNTVSSHTIFREKWCPLAWIYCFGTKENWWGFLIESST